MINLQFQFKIIYKYHLKGNVTEGAELYNDHIYPLFSLLRVIYICYSIKLSNL